MSKNKEVVTVLKVIIPINKRTIKFFLKVLTGDTIGKNRQILAAEKCAKKYREVNELPVSKDYPPTQFQTYRLIESEFNLMFTDAKDRAKNDSFFEDGDND